MKQTITEIFIEVEETIRVKSGMLKKPSSQNSEENLNQVIEICPHCHRAIFKSENDEKKYEIKGDSKI